MNNTFPQSPGPESTKIATQVQNMVNVSQSLRRVVSSRGGQRWQFALKYPPLLRDQVAELWTFINAQGGRLGSFYFYFPNQPTRGTMAGAPVVDGADQLGKSLATTGWPPNSPGVLRVGDFIRLDGHYKNYQVTEDVKSDADGKALVPIFPGVQDSPFNAAPLVSDNRFRVSLTSDTQGLDISQALTYGLDVALIEVLT